MTEPTDYESAYYTALMKCSNRYSNMLAFSPDDSDEMRQLSNFVTHDFTAGIRSRLPIPKLCRWLGYIQGVLIDREVTTVETERDWTRPLFRPLDFPTPQSALEAP